MTTTPQAVTAYQQHDGSVTYYVPPIPSPTPRGMVYSDCTDAIDAAVYFAELALIDAGSVPGESVTVGVHFTDADRRAAADLTQ